MNDEMNALQQIGQALATTKAAIDLLSSAKSLLPKSSKDKAAIEQALEQARRAMALAEAEIARDLEYELCQCTFPPQIALRKAQGQHICPACGRNVMDDYVQRDSRFSPRG